MIADTLLRALERIHGHLGVLGTAALLHPAILLRRPNRRAPLAVAFATALVSATGAIGAYLYPIYRSRLKQEIFIHTPAVGWIFERKEHLAVGAIAFAWIGFIAHIVAPNLEPKHKEPLQKLAQRAFALSFLFSLAVAVFGVVVASVKGF